MPATPTLSDSWLTGSYRPKRFGLTQAHLIPRKTINVSDVIFYAIAEARRTLEGQSEEYVRTLWKGLDTIFRLWATENSASQLETTRWEYRSHYERFCHLRKQEYAPLTNFIASTAEERALAALILHDCADDLVEDVIGAFHELTFHNGYRAAIALGREQGKKIGAMDLFEKVHPLLEKMSQSKKNLAKGRPKGQKINKRRATLMRKLFRTIYADMLRQNPAWGIWNHADYIAKWAKTQRITIDGDFKAIPYQGTTFEVKTGGKRNYTTRYIEDVLKGQRRKNNPRKKTAITSRKL